MPLKTETVNPSKTAKSSEEFIGSIENIPKGTSFGEVITHLKIGPKTPGVLEIVRRDLKQEILFGNVTNVPGEIEAFVKELDRYRVLYVHYKDLQSTIRIISPVTLLIEESGPDFEGYLTFYDEMFVEFIKPEYFHKGEKKKIFLPGKVLEELPNVLM